MEKLSVCQQEIQPEKLAASKPHPELTHIRKSPPEALSLPWSLWQGSRVTVRQCSRAQMQREQLSVCWNFPQGSALIQVTFLISSLDSGSGPALFLSSRDGEGGTFQAERERSLSKGIKNNTHWDSKSSLIWLKLWGGDIETKRWGSECKRPPLECLTKETELYPIGDEEQSRVSCCGIFTLNVRWRMVQSERQTTQMAIKIVPTKHNKGWN